LNAQVFSLIPTYFAASNFIFFVIYYGKARGIEIDPFLFIGLYFTVDLHNIPCFYIYILKQDAYAYEVHTDVKPMERAYKGNYRIKYISYSRRDHLATKSDDWCMHSRWVVGRKKNKENVSIKINIILRFYFIFSDWLLKIMIVPIHTRTQTDTFMHYLL